MGLKPRGGSSPLQRTFILEGPTRSPVGARKETPSRESSLAQPSVSESGSRRLPVVPCGETEPGGAQPVSEGRPPGPGIPP